MHLMYYINDKGERVYTIAKTDPSGKPTKSAHPARFSPDEKEDFVACRVTLKDRYRLLPHQIKEDREKEEKRRVEESAANEMKAALDRQVKEMLESQRSVLGAAAFEDTGRGPAIANAVKQALGIDTDMTDSNEPVTTGKRRRAETLSDDGSVSVPTDSEPADDEPTNDKPTNDEPTNDEPKKHKSKRKRGDTVRRSHPV
ncbi:MAG: hypothetical protein Q9157_008958 [Trypethelium eluteriae]